MRRNKKRKSKFILFRSEKQSPGKGRRVVTAAKSKSAGAHPIATARRPFGSRRAVLSHPPPRARGTAKEQRKRRGRCRPPPPATPTRPSPRPVPFSRAPARSPHPPRSHPSPPCVCGGVLRARTCGWERGGNGGTRSATAVQMRPPAPGYPTHCEQCRVRACVCVVRAVSECGACGVVCVCLRFKFGVL